MPTILLNEPRIVPIEVKDVSRDNYFMALSVDGELWKLLKAHMDKEFYGSFNGGTIHGIVAEDEDDAVIRNYSGFMSNGKKIYPIYRGIFPMPNEI